MVMKNRFFFRLFLLIVISFPFITAKAQNVVPGKDFSPYWEVGINGGTSLFFGDIKQKPFFPISKNNNEWRLGGGLVAGYQFTPVFGLRGQMLYGQLAGTKKSLDRYFESDYIEFNLNTTINLNNLFGKKRSDRFASAYLLVGVGITNYNSTFYNLSTGSKIGYIGFGSGSGIKGRTLEGILTGGVGVNFRINGHFVANFETANRIMNSDKMDGWVKNFKYDVYNYTSLGLTYRFGRRQTRSVPQIPAEHQNLQEVLPGKKKLVKEKKPCTVEMQPLMPPVSSTSKLKTTAATEKQHQVVVPVQQPQHHVTKTYVATPPPARPLLEYRVQISAKHGQRIAAEWISNKYGLPQNEIREDKHNGYYIYTIGSYQTYGQARTRRDQLRSHNGISDAFVVAFKNGYRLDKLP